MTAEFGESLAEIAGALRRAKVLVAALPASNAYSATVHAVERLECLLDGVSGAFRRIGASLIRSRFLERGFREGFLRPHDPSARFAVLDATASSFLLRSTLLRRRHSAASALLGHLEMTSLLRSNRTPTPRGRGRLCYLASPSFSLKGRRVNQDLQDARCSPPADCRVG
jgi:hypothetical protein